MRNEHVLIALACVASACGGGGGGDQPDASSGVDGPLLVDAPLVDAARPIDARPVDAGPTWTCNPSYYNANDGCDCNCGIPDPDCATPGPVFNCGNAVAPYCNANGTCGDWCNGTPVNGMCVDADTIASCFVPEQPSSQPHVITSDCPQGYACAQDAAGARCDLIATCIEGSTFCSDATTLQTCTGGNFAASTCASGPCQPNPGVGAACAPGAAVATVTGRVQYEFRQRLSNLSGYSGLVLGNAASMVAAVVDSGNVLGSSYTDTNGNFSIAVYSSPSVNAQVWLIPYIEYLDGRPLTAVALPSPSCPPGGTACSDLSSGDGLWVWSIPLGGATDTGTRFITEAIGSGAVYIHQWQWFAISTLMSRFPSVQAPSVVTMWRPEVRYTCGACFYGQLAQVGQSGLPFQSSILMTGTSTSPEHWAASVINHEVGHYAMWAFSVSPGEGGEHGFTGLSTPGLAWSEGWASYHGQSLMQDPFYFDYQNGQAIYVNLEEVSTNQGTVPMPTASGGMDQPINEFVVASMLWDLADATPNEDPVSIGDPSVFAGMGSSRLLNTAIARGYARVDLVDYLDGLRCDGRAQAADLTSGIIIPFGFPYDNNPSCSTPTSPMRLSLVPLRTLKDDIELQLAIDADGPLPPLTLTVESPTTMPLSKGRQREQVRVAVGTRTMRTYMFTGAGHATASNPIKIVVEGKDAGFGISATVQYPLAAPATLPRFTSLPSPVRFGKSLVNQIIPVR